MLLQTPFKISQIEHWENNFQLHNLPGGLATVMTEIFLSEESGNSNQNQLQIKRSSA